jgi:predicted O-methyltransferase YrrM
MPVMNDTLNDANVRKLLAHLFDEAKKTDRWDTYKGPAPQQLDYRTFYGSVKTFYLPVSPESGRLLYMLARGSNARNIVEFGTSFGVSTIHLAAAIRDNGGGRVIGTEFEPTKVARARENLQSAGLADLVEIREGDALTTLSKGLPETIDLVLLDGHKPLYARVLDLLAPRLRSGAYIIADNVDMCPEYVQRVREAGSGYLSLRFEDDVELTLKL